MTDFRDALQDLINKYNKDQISDVPDYVLAQFLQDCLDAFDKAVRDRDCFHNFKVKM